MASRGTIELGLVLYPDVQMAAVLGLTDLFAVGNRTALLRGEASRQGEVEVAPLRVTHWRETGPGKAMRRVFDTGPESVGEPAALILPPSLADPIEPEQAAPYAEWLRSFHASGGTLVSVCAGAFLLGETGLLAGRTATTHWGLSERFASRFPDVRLDIDRLIVDEGDIVTFAGVWLVRRVPAERFYRLIYWLLLLVGAKLVFDGARSLF